MHTLTLTRIKALITIMLLAIEALPLWRSRAGFAVRAILGLGRRYGVRCHAGSLEKQGFLYRGEAEAWGRSYYGPNYIVYYYEPIDLRITPSEYGGRVRYTGCSAA
jgi:hypothetical protein